MTNFQQLLLVEGNDSRTSLKALKPQIPFKMFAKLVLHHVPLTSSLGFCGCFWKVQVTLA